MTHLHARLARIATAKIASLLTTLSKKYHVSEERAFVMEKRAHVYNDRMRFYGEDGVSVDRLKG
jgi:hypothetical protein